MPKHECHVSVQRRGDTSCLCTTAYCKTRWPLPAPPHRLQAVVEVRPFGLEHSNLNMWIVCAPRRGGKLKVQLPSIATTTSYIDIYALSILTFLKRTKSCRGWIRRPQQTMCHWLIKPLLRDEVSLFYFLIGLVLDVCVCVCVLVTHENWKLWEREKVGEREHNSLFFVWGGCTRVCVCVLSCSVVLPHLSVSQDQTCILMCHFQWMDSKERWTTNTKHVLGWMKKMQFSDVTHNYVNCFHSLQIIVTAGNHVYKM